MPGAGIGSDGDMAALATRLVSDPDFLGKLAAGVSPLVKSDIDTFTSANVPSWFDLSPVVQYMFPFKEFIPLISRIPREPGNGDNAHHWKRVTAINTSAVQVSVQEGQRGGRIQVATDEQTATYKFLGLESDVTFQAWLASKNMTPDALGIDIQSTLRATMIGEEAMVLHGNAALALGTTGTVTASHDSATSSAFTGAEIFVICVALSGEAWLYWLATGIIPGQIQRSNPDGSQIVYGGGSAQPSAESNTTPSAGNNVTASVVPTVGAMGYAWFIGLTTGVEQFAGITYGNSVIFTKLPSGSAQVITTLKVGASYQDNSTNQYAFDGMFTQMNATVFGTAPSTAMQTGTPTGKIVTQASGSLSLTLATGNTGLTVQGSNILEFDEMLQSLYDVYKLSPDRILMSSRDLIAWTGAMLSGGSSTYPFMEVFDAEQNTGRIIAGRRITSYLNKVLNNEIPIEVHPFVTPGTILFWSDRVPYELAGVQYLTCIRTRMDYYQIRWPLRTTKWEFGVYMDEVLENTFCPAFAYINNVNLTTGPQSF
jgi:hypothetical protein